AGGKVDDQPARVPLVAEVRQGTLDAVDALLDRQLRQADQEDLRQPRAGIDLGLHGYGLDAQQREGVELGEHGRWPCNGSVARLRRNRWTAVVTHDAALRNRQHALAAQPGLHALVEVAESR